MTRTQGPPFSVRELYFLPLSQAQPARKPFLSDFCKDGKYLTKFKSVVPAHINILLLLLYISAILTMIATKPREAITRLNVTKMFMM